MTKSPNAGVAQESLQNISQDLGASSVPDAKQSIKTKLEKLLEKPDKWSHTTCYIKGVLESLDKDAKTLFEKALADDRIQHVLIARLLEEEGFKTSEATIRRHRKGGCRCVK